MGAELLRRAADRLDEAVDHLSQYGEDWDAEFPADRVYGDRSTYSRLIVHPSVGHALAAWLRDTAEFFNPNSAIWGRAEAVARQILSEDSA